MIKTENTYFNINIQKNNEFYIIDSSEMYESELSTLEKIEKIISNNSNYFKQINDKYSKISKSELFDLLRKKSTEIKNEYDKKLASKNALEKIFSGNEKNHIKLIYNRIFNYPVLPLYDQMIQEILSHLPLTDLARFACTNRHAKTQTFTAMLLRARSFRFTGNDFHDGMHYLARLFQEVKLLNQKNSIPKNYISNEIKKDLFLKKIIFKPEKTLKNLEVINSEDVFFIFSKPRSDASIFSNHFINIRNFLTHCKDSGAISQSADDLQRKALENALQYDEPTVIEMLLRHGINVNLSLFEQTTTALHTVVEKWPETTSLQIVKLLLQHGAAVTIPNKNGNLPQHVAAHYGLRAIMHLLLKRGIDIEATGRAGNRALTYACSSNTPNMEMVQLLLEQGANVNAQNIQLMTPLAYLCKQPCAEMVELLLKKGADPKIANKDGNLPQHFAAANNYVDVMRVLLEFKIDLESIGFDGNTALTDACKYKQNEMVKFLLEKKANPNAVTQDNKTPLSIARDNHSEYIEKILIEHGAD